MHNSGRCLAQITPQREFQQIKASKYLMHIVTHIPHALTYSVFSISKQGTDFCNNTPISSTRKKKKTRRFSPDPTKNPLQTVLATQRASLPDEQNFDSNSNPWRGSLAGFPWEDVTRGPLLLFDPNWSTTGWTAIVRSHRQTVGTEFYHTALLFIHRKIVTRIFKLKTQSRPPSPLWNPRFS